MDFHWDFSFLLQYRGILLQGTLNTLRLSLVIMVFGFLLGALIASLRLSKRPLLRGLGLVYVELFRNLPALVLLFWFYYALPLATGIQNDRFLTAAVGFSLYTAAYFCEILYSGMRGIDKGQWESTAALGFSRRDQFISILLPQAIKNTLPSLTNELIEIVKISAVAATIAYPELLYQAKLLADTEYRPVEAYTAVAVLLTAVALVLSGISYALETRFKKAS